MLVRMSEEDPDYEGKWPEGDAMSERVLVPREPTPEMIRAGWPTAAPDWVVEALYRAMLDAAPAAPQMTGEFGHLAGRGMHELRTDELAQYVVSLAAGHGPFSHVVKAALDWIVSELERKTNDERALAVKLDAIRAAPQQAEPVAWMKPTRDSCYLRSAETMLAIHEDCDGIVRTGWKPLYLHPPANEAQRLARDFHRLQVAATAVTTALYDRERLFAVAELRAALAALEGGE